MYPRAISDKVIVLQQFEQGWFGTMKVVLETAPPLFLFKYPPPDNLTPKEYPLIPSPYLPPLFPATLDFECELSHV